MFDEVTIEDTRGNRRLVNEFEAATNENSGRLVRRPVAGHEQVGNMATHRRRVFLQPSQQVVQGYNIPPLYKHVTVVYWQSIKHFCTSLQMQMLKLVLVILYLMVLIRFAITFNTP